MELFWQQETKNNRQKRAHLPQSLMWNLTTWELKLAFPKSSHFVPQHLSHRNQQVNHLPQKSCTWLSNEAQVQEKKQLIIN